MYQGKTIHFIEGFFLIEDWFITLFYSTMYFMAFKGSLDSHRYSLSTTLHEHGRIRAKNPFHHCLSPWKSWLQRPFRIICFTLTFTWCDLVKVERTYCKGQKFQDKKKSFLTMNWARDYTAEDWELLPALRSETNHSHLNTRVLVHKRKLTAPGGTYS